MSRTLTDRVQLGIENLENRELLSVSQLWFSGNTLVVKTDNVATSVAVNVSGSNIRIDEVGTNRSWSYASSLVGQVEFQGGAGSDRFVNNVYSLKSRAFGFGGNDYLEGYNGADYFSGGDGHDTMVGYGGNDTMFGGIGNDVMRGMGGDDQMVGQDGNDQMNGREGNDSAWGGLGNDVLIAIDGATGDYVQGDAGRDIYWIDRNGSYLDRVYGLESGDIQQEVAAFANGADRTLDGDRIWDPTVKSGHSYRTFAGNPLFSSSGPRAADIRQGNLGDCWALAGFGAVANDNSFALRQNIVDFDDGTYGVRLGNSFYRVDNDLPVWNGTSSLAYASLGAENSMWVAIAEKAYAHYRTGANSYASLESGWSIEVNRAFRSASPGEKSIGSYSSATALANDIYSRWNGFQAVTIGFVDGRVAAGAQLPGAPLINSHMYTVISVARNASGVVTSITLRNPWGYDGAGSDANTSDGLVTVTPAQLFGIAGRVNWGRV